MKSQLVIMASNLDYYYYYLNFELVIRKLDRIIVLYAINIWFNKRVILTQTHHSFYPRLFSEKTEEYINQTLSFASIGQGQQVNYEQLVLRVI